MGLFSEAPVANLLGSPSAVHGHWTSCPRRWCVSFSAGAQLLKQCPVHEACPADTRALIDQIGTQNREGRLLILTARVSAHRCPHVHTVPLGESLSLDFTCVMRDTFSGCCRNQKAKRVWKYFERCRALLVLPHPL